LVVASLAQGQATGFQVEDIPVAISVEGRPVRSTLYLQVDKKSYQMTLEQFAAQKLDDRQRAFLQGLRAVRSHDYQGLKSIWQAPPDNPNASMGFDMKDPQTFVDTYSKGYGNYEGLRILSQIELGSESLFLWGAKATTTGTFWPDGAILRATGGKVVFTPVTPASPVANLIVDTLLASTVKPQEYTPAKDLKVKYRSVLFLAGKQNPGAHPVAFVFDGTAMNFSVFDTAEPSPTPLLEFYRSAYLALKKRSFVDYVSKFTPESQPQVKTWTQNLSAANATEYFNALVSSRYVKFVLNADPIFLVFYSGDKTDKWTAATLHCEYVVRDPGSNAYKLANFAFTSSLDDILRNPELFNEQSFRQTTAPAVAQPRGSM
jgi:hypothetical protein